MVGIGLVLVGRSNNYQHNVIRICIFKGIQVIQIGLYLGLGQRELISPTFILDEIKLVAKLFYSMTVGRRVVGRIGVRETISLYVYMYVQV